GPKSSEMFAAKGVKEDGDEHAANSLYLPRRYLDARRRKHCRARGWRRGLSGRARDFPRRLRTLARHSHHLAARCASDRGQPASARGVTGRLLINGRSQCPLLSEVPQRPSSMVYTVKVHLQRTLADLMFPPHCQSGRGCNESAVVLGSLIRVALGLYYWMGWAEWQR